MFRNRHERQSLYKALGSSHFAPKAVEFSDGPRYSARQSRKHDYLLNMAGYGDKRYDERWVTEMKQNERDAYFSIAKKTQLLLQKKISRF